MSILFPRGKSLTEQALDQVKAEAENQAVIEVDLKGVEASISTEKQGWGVTAFVKKMFGSKDVQAGARVTKKF
jgi:hypothetical protein